MERCTIGYKKDNGDYEYSYCHYDGFLNGVGVSLLKDYNTETKAKALVKGGDMDSPEESYYSKGENWDKVAPLTASIRKQVHTQTFSYIWESPINKWIFSEDGKIYESLEDILGNK